MPLKIPLVLTPQPDGGYTVTSPLFPELHAEGDTADGAVVNVNDALAGVVELYEELNRPLPQAALIGESSGPGSFEALVAAP